jgi:hypothetical protein
MSKRNMIFKKNLVAHALVLAFGAGMLTVGVAPVAMAQSNASGIIYGKVASPAGATVTMVNKDTGLKRTEVLDAAGRFSATSLPIGTYNVTVVRDGKVVSSSTVEVIVGQGVEAVFGGSEVQSVQVVARRNRIDVSNTNNGATFTSKELARLPIAPSVASIIQLAPNTTRGDPRYAAGDSFGGGGPSENAYYINGFPVTNPLTQLGASELPFGAIAQAQVLTGGFGAEFGRSVGGVVNITTKSGTNDWVAGAMTAIEPNGLRAKSKDRYFAVTGDPSNAKTDGKLLRRREDNKIDGNTVGAYVGGPIIKDKLFMFLSAERVSTKSSLVNSDYAGQAYITNGWLEQKTTTDRYVGKFDWNLTDDHRLELSLIGDDSRSDRQTYGYNYLTNTRSGVTYNALTRDNVLALSAKYANDPTGVATPTVGGDVKLLKYVGNLTSDLTLTTSYGISSVKHTNEFVNASTLPAALPTANGAYPGITYRNPNPVNFNVIPDGAKDEVKSFRLDLEYKLGSHTIRGGLDDNKLKSINAGTMTSGGATWSYRFTPTPNTPITLSAGTPVAVATGGGLGKEGYYVRKVVFSTSTAAGSDQSAQYLEDRYQVTKDILLIAGLRSETFSNTNGDNEKFLEQKNKIAPRFAGSWDVNGDASFKVFGSAGRYHVQIPTNVTVRGASRATNTQQFFTYTGVDANGQPLGLVKLTEPRSANNELGQRKDPRTITSKNLEPSFQDELTLGFEKAYSPSLNFGTKLTYRTLRATADDFCDQTPVDEWAARNKVDTSKWTYGFGCVIMNPGEASTFQVDFNNGDPALAGKKLTDVTLSAAELGFPKAKRVYTAIDLFAEHPFRDGWYGKVNYTWSRSTGNTEGQTNSDTGQANVSITAVWDQKYLAEYADGLLPNNRTHQLKAYGFYQLAPEWTIGGNFLAASGRLKSCLGVHPDQSVKDLGYENSYHYCLNAQGKSVPAPRGKNGSLPWDIRLDMNVVYQPAFAKGFLVKMDVFNVMNKQTPQAMQDTHDTGAGDGIFANYDSVLSYTPARRARLSVEYHHKF